MRQCLFFPSPLSQTTGTAHSFPPGYKNPPRPHISWPASCITPAQPCAEAPRFSHFSFGRPLRNPSRDFHLSPFLAPRYKSAAICKGPLPLSWSQFLRLGYVSRVNDRHIPRFRTNSRNARFPTSAPAKQKYQLIKERRPRVWGGEGDRVQVSALLFFFHARAKNNNNGITQQYEQRLPQYSSDRHPACLLQPEIPHALFLLPTSPLCLVFFFCFLCLEKLCFSHLPFPSWVGAATRPHTRPGERGGSKKSMHAAYILPFSYGPGKSSKYALSLMRQTAPGSVASKGRRRRAHISLPFLTRPTRRRRRHLISPLPCVPASCDT